VASYQFLPPGPQLFFGRFELSARYRVPHRLADRPVASSPSIKGVFWLTSN
jgi:hypothetical protein